MQYRIGSFNVRGLNDAKLLKIAELIKQLEFDIVALQEVSDPDLLLELKRKAEDGTIKYLGPRWGCAFCKPIQYSSQSAKGYAFLWNKDRIIRLSTDDVKQYRSVSLGMNKLMRRPFYGRFRPKFLPKVEFRLINVHLAYGKPAALDEEPITQKQLRQDEFKILTEDIFPRIRNTVYDSGAAAAYTIMLGDYNLNLRSKWTGRHRIFDQIDAKNGSKFKSLSSEYISAIKESLAEELDYITTPIVKSEGESIKTVQDQLTSLRVLEDSGSDSTKRKTASEKLIEKLSKKGISVNDTLFRIAVELMEKADEEFQLFKSNYDHFTYCIENFNGVPVRYRRIREAFDLCYVNVDQAQRAVEYRREISDHIPIMIEIDLRDGK